jgi:hypothetical protein
VKVLYPKSSQFVKAAWLLEFCSKDVHNFAASKAWMI